MNPPTDRLNKFLAVVGLALIGFGYVYPQEKREAWRQAHAELGIEIAKSNYVNDEFKEAVQKFDEAQKEVQTLVDEAEATVNTGDAEQAAAFDSSSLEASNQMLKRMAEELSRLGRNLDQQGSIMKIAQTKHEFRASELAQARLIGWLSIGVGLVCSYFGFRSWFRSERPQKEHLSQGSEGQSGPN